MKQTNDKLPAAEEVLADLEQHRGSACHGCGDTLSGHDVVMSVAMGFRNAPRCLACLAVTYQRTRDDFRAYVLDYIKSRSCYHTAWEKADALESGAGQEMESDTLVEADAFVNVPEADISVDREWDAGDMRCADLVLDLRLRLQEMYPGQVLKVIAEDPAAPLDMPAWCRVSRHPLLRSEHPVYWIQRRTTKAET
jgi:tRNA 2-thiouridine synthesizing protein A